jgi:two-component system, OmpR family, phosphate regulon response regulator PhoB
MVRVLVADDAAMVRRVVCRSLQPHETLEAEDGRQALEMLRVYSPKVAILDWMMPGLSGLEVCQEARSDPSTTQTIFVIMTARREQGAEDQARLAGVSHFIRKPFMPLELADLVLPLLEGSRPTGDAGRDRRAWRPDGREVQGQVRRRSEPTDDPSRRPPE